VVTSGDWSEEGEEACYDSGGNMGTGRTKFGVVRELGVIKGRSPLSWLIEGGQHFRGRILKLNFVFFRVVCVWRLKYNIQIFTYTNSKSKKH